MKANNKLIAEFIGVELKPNECGRLFRYHKSWDWLMPVIHKCFDVAEYGQMSDIMHHLQVAEMGDTYDAVVEIIKGYNQNN